MNEEKEVKNGLASKIDSFFKVSESGSTIRTEIIAGIVTFLAMAYILTVNPGYLTGLYIRAAVPNTALWSSIFIATAISAIIGTLLMAFLAKMPFAQAPGLGLNAVTAGLVYGTLGFSYGNVMLLVLISGLIFIFLTTVPCGRNKENGQLISLREKIFDGIPACVRNAITVGIGLFIAYIGLSSNGGIISNNSLVKFSQLFTEDGFSAVAPAIVCLIGFFSITILAHFNVKGAVIIGILIATVVGIPLGVSNIDTLIGKGDVTWKFWENFTNFFSFDTSKSVFAAAFVEGFDFSAVSAAKGAFGTIATTVITFVMIDMFDTMGTVVGCASSADMIDETGKPFHYNNIMLSDAIATCTGAMTGTSTVTTFVESGSGIAAGGRTGLTALSTACMFFLAIFLLPLFAFIPGAATGAALIYVGVLMMGSVKNIDFKNIRSAAPAFMTLITMVCAASITDGIGMGMVSYVFIECIIYVVDIIKYAINKEKYAKPQWVLSPVALVVAALFIAYFCVK